MGTLLEELEQDLKLIEGQAVVRRDAGCDEEAELAMYKRSLAAFADGDLKGAVRALRSDGILEPCPETTRMTVEKFACEGSSRC